ncbi:MAG: DUF1549 domain-containing protein [Planctomycetia bacterium]|nr:DUF1549 domain-containing protein [Planctomycetia bacterium]
MKRIALGLFAALLLAAPLEAAEVLPAASQRFAAAEGADVPSFQRHVLPLLGRLGCNGRACHGSFQGQGGFRLSLFGYDFQADHAGLVGGEAPRTNLKEPAASLMLTKATRAVGHKGGQRVQPATWQYHLLLRWIKNGAPTVQDGDADFVALEIEPKEIVFGKVGESRQLRVVARWSDGAQEDVTPLCRFRSNDEAIATVSEAGLVTTVGKGDTDIVAFYDNGVAPVQVLLPVSELVGTRYPAVPTPTKLDELVVAKLRKLGVTPSDLCTDAEFLRRISLDLTGSLPAPDEVAAFLADTAADKRAKKIDELLERPTYAPWWATRLCDWTGASERTGPLGGEQSLNRDKAGQWYAWVHRRVRENVPYDKLVEGIVLAVGRKPDQTFDDYAAEMSAYFRKDGPADFSARPTMPYFWTRRTVGKSEDKALSLAHAFLGVNLQCAQCHKHPYDQWTKQDFDQFSAFFNGVRYGDANRVRVQEMKKTAGLGGLDEDSGAYKRQFVELLAQGKILPFKELTIPAPVVQKPGAAPRRPAGRVITPKLLGGEEVIANRYPDPRQPLMDWMRQDDNPYFARAFVNRVWAGYFNVGIIDPPDDHNLANPPSNPALLAYLAREFVQQGYDMKWLHRTIANSRTYQLSWKPNDTNRHDERNFSRAVLRRLPAEVAYDALVQATASDASRKALLSDPVSTRAIGVSSGFVGARDAGNYAVTLFGKPARTINCDCERSTEPSLLQTVYLRNDPEVLKLLDRKDSWLQQVRAGDREADTLIRQAYLRTLSRLPDERERTASLKYLREAPDLVSGLRDLLWALLNTKEFLVNR